MKDNPFMAGAFHGSGEADVVINLGASGPGVVRQVLAQLSKAAPINLVSDTVEKSVPDIFINHGGRIPAPLRSLRN